MYYYLTKAVKERLIQELRYVFAANPRHKDIVPNIQQKFEFSERPQKAIVLQGASATPMGLSADNYMGSMYSRVMLGHVDEHPGQAIEWVKEDQNAIDQNGGVFPGTPGVYYVEIEDITPADDCATFQFWVDPLLTVEDEHLITFSTGSETSATLLNAPLLGASLSLYDDGGQLLRSGTAFQMTADSSLYLHGGNSNLPLGLDEGYVAPVLTSTNTAPFTITSSNDTLVLAINGKTVMVTLPTGNLTVDDVASAIEAAAPNHNVGASEFEVTSDSGALRIETTQSLYVEDDTTSTANVPLGLIAGDVSPAITGRMVQPFVPKDSVFRVVIDGVEFEFQLTSGRRTVQEIATEIADATTSSSLSVTTTPAGDYSLDATTGEVTFLRSYLVGTEITASYRYPLASQGPYPIEDGHTSNNEAIEGVVLAFGDQLEDGDAMAVVVEHQRKDVADLYGGKMDMSVDFDIIARDSMTRSELADLVIGYLWQLRRERLAEEGIIINNVSHGGESEEPYDDTGDDYYYLASISLTLQTDWEFYIARPLVIRTLTPTSYDFDAQRAASEDGVLTEQPDLSHAVDDEQLEKLALLYFHDRGEIERVR